MTNPISPNARIGMKCLCSQTHGRAKKQMVHTHLCQHIIKIRLFTPYEIYMGETTLLSANLHHIKVIGNNNSTIEILPRLGSISPTALSKRSILCVIEQEIADIK